MTMDAYPVAPDRVLVVTGTRTLREIDDWEWAAIRRLRQLRKEGNGDRMVIDPRTREGWIIQGLCERFDKP